MELRNIPLAKITPAFKFKRCKSVINSLKQNMNFTSVLYFPFFVEQQPNGMYLLISSYQDYYAFKETYNEKEKDVMLPCVVIKTKISGKERLLIMFRYLLLYSKLDPLDKHALFVQLRKHITVETLAKETGHTIQEVMEYLLHPNIPCEFRSTSNLNRLLMLNNIEKLEIDSELKQKLFYLAVLHENHPKRLTYEKLMCFSRFLSRFKNELGRISKIDKETLLIKIIESDIYIDYYLESLLAEYVNQYKRYFRRTSFNQTIQIIPFPVKNQHKHIRIKLKNKIFFTY
ncbi:hypothetical protein [Alkalihalobacterium elongatum]|uniref:hypothetical protein n=1 Tax=Alkalihalobacterium elongatum TaxID=2675466 RepID=UPI001C1F7211|nr:hypothetical protein [Alkalihalobacterium elongatum]